MRESQRCGDRQSNRWKQTANILRERCEKRAFYIGRVACAGSKRYLRSKAKFNVQIERDGQLLAIIVVRDAKTTAENRFAILAKESGRESLFEIWRPCKRDTRLEIISVPVVKWSFAICRTRQLNRQGIIVGNTRCSSSKPAAEKFG